MKLKISKSKKKIIKIRMEIKEAENRKAMKPKGDSLR
jgi:hypothetical protein